MALTDVNTQPAGFDPAPGRGSFDALSALPRLHAEANANFALAQFLSRTPAASLILMASGAGVLLATAGGSSLKAGFAWAVLVLIGVIAMTRNFIRGFARSLRRVPLEEAASDLRVLLLYTGAAWGAGAFLVLPTLPAPALAFSFAVIPALAMTFALKDLRGSLYFLWPAALATMAAAVQGAWPYDMAVTAAVLAAATVLTFIAAQQKKR